MEFFDKLGKKASEAYKVTADKTGKIAKETKIKFKIGDLKSKISELYEEIGKKVYEKHVREEDINIKEDLEEQCTKIDVLSDEIEELLKQSLELRDRKQCPNCYTELDKDEKFCHNCGKKQDDEPAQEVEILEDLENAEVREEKQDEKEIVKENLEYDLENKQTENEQPNESNNQENVEQENIEQENSEEEKNNIEKTVEIESNVDFEKQDNNT